MTERKYTYQADFEIDVSKLSTHVDDILESINTVLAKHGCSHQVSATVNIFSLTVSVDRPLTNEEESMVGELLQDSINVHLPSYDISLRTFRRKSGNVLQSVS